jgi:ABC-type transport system involved in multi-copper enzyme maturation permease subunit
MATAAPRNRSADLPRPSGRVKNALPWVGVLVWAVGAVGVWYAGQRYHWSPGELVLAGCAWLGVLAVAARDFIRGMFGPVFTYEITRLGRRRLTFILRLLYVICVLALLLLRYLDWLGEVGYFRQGADRVPYERLSNFATSFFYIFMGVQYAVIVLLTPAYVAGTVADEKERKTLEFLLATDLRNREIIFGKVAARVTNLLMYVLAGLPVIAFMQLFGGIDPDQLLAATAATVITVIGLSAVSVAFSVAMRRPRDAIALAYLATLVYIAGSFALAMFVLVQQFTLARTGAAPWVVLGLSIDPVKVLDVVREITDWIAAGNVAYALVSMAGPSNGNVTPDMVATALFRYAVFWGLATALFLGYAVWRLRAVALYQSYGAPKQVGRGRAARAAKARPAVGDDPMFWKEVFVESGFRGGCVGWVISVAVVALVFVGPIMITYFAFFDRPSYRGSGTAEQWRDFTEGMNGWCRIATGFIGFLLMMAAAVRGAGAVSGERDRDTWVSLMSTPLTAWEMLRAKWLGCVLGLRRGYTLLLAVWALALAVGAVDPPMILVTVLYTAVFVSAFAWIGVFNSITSRTSLIATIRTIMIALFLAGGFWVFLALCCGLPLGLILDRPDLDLLEYVTHILGGCTPPFVLGWLPLVEYDRRAMEPFSWEERYSLGPLNPVVGFFVWFGLNWVFGLLSWQAFRKATNRARDTLADQLPRPKARPEPNGKPAVARPVQRPPRFSEPGEEPIILD